MTATSNAPIGTHPEPAVTRAEHVFALVADQHRWLRAEMSRVPRLHDGARQDVFLHLRRQLAVHEALEELVLVPRLPAGVEKVRVDRELASAEAAAPETVDFDAAHARVTVGFLHHLTVVEGTMALVRAGALDEREQRAVAAVQHLWDGEGETYLGNDWADMQQAARDAVARAADDTHQPVVRGLW